MYQMSSWALMIEGGIGMPIKKKMPLTASLTAKCLSLPLEPHLV
jgi:hypothetical protein